MKYSYNEIVNQLRDSVLTVTFTKVDGTNRVMRCTLMQSYLPEEFKSRAPMLTETAPQTVSVWDVDAGGWRSFRLDTVTNIQ